jgi:hypothetical protein
MTESESKSPCPQPGTRRCCTTQYVQEFADEFRAAGYAASSIAEVVRGSSTSAFGPTRVAGSCRSLTTGFSPNSRGTSAPVLAAETRGCSSRPEWQPARSLLTRGVSASSSPEMPSSMFFGTGRACDAGFAHEVHELVGARGPHVSAYRLFTSEDEECR